MATQNSFRSKVFSTYLSAVKKRSVSFCNTTSYLAKENGVTYQIRFAPQLLKKPTNPAPTSSPVKPRHDPFEKPDEDLFVTTIGGSSNTHFIVLNKYPVIPAHFILATTKFENQADKLTRGDLSAVCEVFHKWYEDDSPQQPPPSQQEQQQHHISETAIADADITKRTDLFGFFNCGDESGASQPHRHLQFLTLGKEEAEGLFITSYIRTHKTPETIVFSHPSVSFEHYIYTFPTTTSLSPEVLCNAYDQLLSRISTTSYNLAFTNTYMAICPRTSETAFPLPRGTSSGVILDGIEITVPGLGLNGTMLAGMMLVKTDVELRSLLEAGGGGGGGGKGLIGRVFGEVGVSINENNNNNIKEGEVKGMI